MVKNSYWELASFLFIRSFLADACLFIYRIGDFGSNSDRVSLVYVAAGRVFKTNCVGIEESVVLLENGSLLLCDFKNHTSNTYLKGTRFKVVWDMH